MVVPWTSSNAASFMATKLAQLPPHTRRYVIDRDLEIKRRRIVMREVYKTSSVGFDENSDLINVLILGDSKSTDFYLAVAVRKSEAPNVKSVKK